MLKNKINLIVYDFDGVMTDNRVTVDQDGKESVVCNRGDGLGINIIKAMEIPQIILSTETNIVVNKRAQKLGIPALQGSQNKKESLSAYCRENGFDFSSTLYVGNDLNDLEVMEQVGTAVCPADAHEKILGISHYITKAAGGQGVIRELAEWLEKK